MRLTSTLEDKFKEILELAIEAELLGFFKLSEGLRREVELRSSLKP